MNCRNCGAAMDLVAGRDYFRCDYCTSFHFPNDTGEGVRIVGGPSNLICPVCRHALQEGRIEGEPVYTCVHCRGFLTTIATFGTIVEKRRAKRPVGESRYSFDPQELRRAVDCPGCQKRMEAHPYYGGGRVVVVGMYAGETVDLLEHGLGMFEHHRADVGELRSATVSAQQLGAALALQLADVSAKRWLRDT